MDLDKQVEGKVFESPLHFIGHGRGAILNSEVIQRLGYYSKVTGGIQYTALDPPIDTIPFRNLTEYGLSNWSQFFDPTIQIWNNVRLRREFLPDDTRDREEESRSARHEG